MTPKLRLTVIGIVWLGSPPRSLRSLRDTVCTNTLAVSTQGRRQGPEEWPARRPGRHQGGGISAADTPTLSRFCDCQAGGRGTIGKFQVSKRQLSPVYETDLGEHVRLVATRRT